MLHVVSYVSLASYVSIMVDLSVMGYQRIVSNLSVLDVVSDLSCKLLDYQMWYKCITISI